MLQHCPCREDIIYSMIESIGYFQNILGICISNRYECKIEIQNGSKGETIILLHFLHLLSSFNILNLKSLTPEFVINSPETESRSMYKL